MTRNAAHGSTRLSELDFAGFAQEFLRRNPEYIAQYWQMTADVASGASLMAQEDMAQNWGLSFPVLPRHSRQ